MNILDQIGIQQWRLRDRPSISVADTKTVDPTAQDELAAVQTRDYSWDMLEQFFAQDECDSCKQGGSVLGEGDRDADWLFLLDAPSTDAIAHCNVISGRARTLYQSILTALRLQVEQVYTTSVFKCAPSQDVLLNASCQEVLGSQIKLLKPKVIVCLGEFSAQSLIKSNDDLAILRQQNQKCSYTKTSVIVSHSLLDLLQTPSLKSQAWSDFKRARRAVLRD